jgi:2,5-diamino-6-(ribosylamino)-4(3H)-pyrimidinone 5'-phosphate reductase
VDFFTDSSQNQGIPNSPKELINNFLTTGSSEVYIFTTSRTSEPQIAKLKSTGVKVQVTDSEQVDMEQVFVTLHKAGIRSVLVEGGGTLIAELFRLKLVDELTVYIAPKIFGGASSPTLVDGRGFNISTAPSLWLISVKRFDPQGGVLLKYKKPTLITS